MKTDAAIVVLYRVLMPSEINTAELGDPGDFSGTAQDALTDIALQADLESRQGRYLANLAYVLGLRIDDAGIESLTPELSVLGATILERFPDIAVGQGAAQEPSLQQALRRLLAFPEVTTDVADGLVAAFDPVLQSSFNPSEGFTFSGPAAEIATMFTELAAMDLHCDCRDGAVMRDGVEVPVLYCRFEICTQAPYDRCMPAVDPRRWPRFSPVLFQSVSVLSGSPSMGNWQGVIQEEVGALFTSGAGYKTNLLVSYHQEQDMAVTTYDLAPNDPALLADDNQIDVDYGFFAVTDEGAHRRITVLKVVHIKGKEDAPGKWLCPLHIMQQAMIGWWFSDAA